MAGENEDKGKSDDRITDDPFENRPNIEVGGDEYDDDDIDDLEDIDFGEDDEDDDGDEDSDIDDILDEMSDPEDDMENILAEMFGEDEEDDDSPFSKFIDAIDRRNRVNEDKDDKPKDEFDQFFDPLYGDGLDFTSMFDTSTMEDGEVDRINKDMNEQFKPMMREMTRQAITASVKLAEQLVDNRFDKAEKEQKAVKQRTDARAAAIKIMPFLEKREHSVTFNALFDKVWDKTNGDGRKTVTTLRKLYKQTNPREFRKGRGKGFSRPSAKRTSTSKRGKPAKVDWNTLLAD